MSSGISPSWPSSLLNLSKFWDAVHMRVVMIFLEMYFKERWADISLSNICNTPIYIFIYAKNICIYSLAGRTLIQLINQTI